MKFNWVHIKNKVSKDKMPSAKKKKKKKEKKKKVAKESHY